ncbi:mitotic-spindle organizing protein 1-like [Homalodisca vitripennis]|uniref:mitotic-spindle organizing protein 1-like n=1 Tax=Homalodisca vitripennis TaxID=197043 RepID=UPI001EEA179C|nr:mitotic-spindle organizing protein 1-like [Homalodisca vitripennis]
MPDKQVCDEKYSEVKETFETMSEISTLLNTGLDLKTLSFCVRLCENGVHPESLAKVITEIRQEVNRMNGQEKK